MAVLSKEQAQNIASVHDIDWTVWQPIEQATLLFIRQDEQLLLIRKKRGLGGGKINAAGGRLEAGESPKECAVRELQEELCITVTDPKYAGEILFQFKDGYSFHLIVYMGSNFEGIPTETDEAMPLWIPVNAIPYDEMWADDIFWVPTMLQNELFFGYFLFDGETMVDGWMAPPAEVTSWLRAFE